VKSKYEKFLELSRLLNTKFNIQPLLYGSLGLEVLTGEKLNADDVDILIPEIYIKDKWLEFMDYLEMCGYKLIDLHEHTFEKDNCHFSFACIDGLESFANVKEKEIVNKNVFDCSYKLMNLQQYLAVYEASSKDNYRKKIAKNTKDETKIKFIKNLLDKGNI